jgi:hypothetical protein
VMKSEWQDNLVRYLGRANVLLNCMTVSQSLKLV